MAPLVPNDVGYKEEDEMSRNRRGSKQRQNRRKRRKAAKSLQEKQHSRSGGEITYGENEWAVDLQKGGKVKVRLKDKKLPGLWARYGTRKEQKKKHRELKRKHKHRAFLFTTTGVN